MMSLWAWFNSSISVKFRNKFEHELTQTHKTHAKDTWKSLLLRVNLELQTVFLFHHLLGTRTKNAVILDIAQKVGESIQYTGIHFLFAANNYFGERNWFSHYYKVRARISVLIFTEFEFFFCTHFAICVFRQFSAKCTHTRATEKEKKKKWLKIELKKNKRAYLVSNRVMIAP